MWVDGSTAASSPQGAHACDFLEWGGAFLRWCCQQDQLTPSFPLRFQALITEKKAQLERLQMQVRFWGVYRDWTHACGMYEPEDRLSNWEKPFLLVDFVLAQRALGRDRTIGCGHARVMHISTVNPQLVKPISTMITHGQNDCW